MVQLLYQLPKRERYGETIRVMREALPYKRHEKGFFKEMWNFYLDTYSAYTKEDKLPPDHAELITYMELFRKLFYIANENKREDKERRKWLKQFE